MSAREKFLWLTAYVAVIVTIVAALFVIRNRTLASLDNPAARAEWQAWRNEAAKQSATGPVRRRVPRSAEPPALTLMRDYFPVMLGGSLFFGSVLFVLCAWAARGAFREHRPRQKSW